MPCFDGCPDEAARYLDNFVEHWPDAVRHAYGVITTIIDDTSPEEKIFLIREMREITPSMIFNNKNDETMGKRHAFYEAVDAVRKYLIKKINKLGHTPNLNDLLTDLKPQPVYAMF